MKKNLIISALTIVSILSISFGYTQKIKADKNELKAIERERLVKELQIKVEEQIKLVELEKRLAERTMEKYQEARLQIELLSRNKSGTK